MDNQTQDLVWACLPKEERLGIVQLYVEFQAESKGDYINRPFWVGIIRKFESIFGEHNLTSDTEPEEMLTVERKKVQEIYDGLLNEKKAVSISTPYGGTITARLQMLQEFFGDKCLPDKPSVQVEPKFKVGDKVRVLGGLANKDMEGKMAFVTRLPQGNCNKFVVTFENGLWTELSEKYLEPYTEPETKVPDNRKILYDALCELESASAKVRKALISLG